MSEFRTMETMINEGIVAVAYTKDGKKYDEILTWETAQTMANEGYKIVAIAKDGHMSAEDIQGMCDRELAAAIDCFGEDHRK